MPELTFPDSVEVLRAALATAAAGRAANGENRAALRAAAELVALRLGMIRDDEAASVKAAIVAAVAPLGPWIVRDPSNDERTDLDAQFAAKSPRVLAILAAGTLQKQWPNPTPAPAKEMELGLAYAQEVLAMADRYLDQNQSFLPADWQG